MKGVNQYRACLLLFTLTLIVGCSVKPTESRCTDIIDSTQRLSCYDQQTSSNIKNTAIAQGETILVIDALAYNAYQQAIFTLSNAQVWQQIDGTTKHRFTIGDTVVIRKGVLSAYYLKKTTANRSINIKRIK